MKKISVLFLFLLTVAGANSQTVTGGYQQLAVITYNIRLNSPGDGVNAWPNRSTKVTQFLREISPEVLCMQEVLAMQLDDITNALPEYSWFGAGRDDGKKLGEYVPILYRTDRFRLLKGGNFWLSENPDLPGKLGWDAACARMVSWIKLIDQTNADTLFVFNTHFDHVGVKARLMSARLLTHAVDSLAGNYPVIITGDFNTSDKDTPHEVITAAGFKDSRTLSATQPVGPEYTFTGFKVTGKPGGRIDFIFVRNTRPVQNYRVRDDSSNGYYLSDHLPVMIRL